MKYGLTVMQFLGRRDINFTLTSSRLVRRNNYAVDRPAYIEPSASTRRFSVQLDFIGGGLRNPRSPDHLKNMEYWIILTAIPVVFLYYYLTSNNQWFGERGIPHIKPIPFLGNMAPAFLRRLSIFDTVDRVYNLDGDAKYVGFMDFNTPVVMIRDRELAKTITVKSFDHFINHGPFFTPEQDPLFGNFLLSMQDQKWRDIRATMSPAFTSSKMKGVFGSLTECATNYVNYIMEQCQDKAFDVNTTDIFTRYTNDVIGTFAFGVSIDSIRNRDNDFYVLGKKSTSFGAAAVIKLSLLRFLPNLCKLFNIRFLTDDVVTFFTDLVRGTIEMRDEKGISRPDMIQLMMETRKRKDGPKLSILEMTSQAYGFFFAGFDTTSRFICFVVQVIAERLDIQERLRSEIDKAFEEHECRPPYDAVTNMVYLEAVLNEVLRLYPSDWAHDRICNADFELPPALPGMKPVVLKAGDLIWIPVYSMQRDPRYFLDPNTFDPERFISNGKLVANSVSSPTFGQGPRMCIGSRLAILETKILIAHLLRKCILRPGQRMMTPFRVGRKGFVMTAEGGFWVEFTPRKL